MGITVWAFCASFFFILLIISTVLALDFCSFQEKKKGSDEAALSVNS